LNSIRKKNVALQRLRNLRFHATENDSIIAYSKREADNLILVVINLDPSFAQETTVHWNMSDLGLYQDNFEVTDLIDGATYNWSAHTYVRLDPTRLSGKVVHIAQVKL
jgi:starch synthase (maltosyl-transferring)